MMKHLQKYSFSFLFYVETASSFLFYEAMDSVQHIAMDPSQVRGYKGLKTHRELESLTCRLSDLPKMNETYDSIESTASPLISGQPMY